MGIPAIAQHDATEQDQQELVDNHLLSQFFTRYRNNKPVLIQTNASDEVLVAVERFVSDCIASKLPGYRTVTRHGQVTFIDSTLSRCYFHRINSYQSRYIKSCFYSPPVELFFSVCQNLSLCNHQFIAPKVVNAQGESDAELFNRLIAGIREKGRSLEYRKKIAQDSYRAFSRFRGLVDYADALFGHVRSRLIVVRLDLKYRLDKVIGMTVGQAQEDLKHFLSNMRNKPTLFDDLVGYIWKLEHGDYGHEHFHVILFFTNDQLLNDSYRAEEIGKYWEQVITKGRGTYFNCNRAVEKAKQKRLCIGRIDYYDDEKRHNLLYPLAYFSKDEQRLQLKPKKTSRSYGRGEMPVPDENRKGAPRKFDVPSRAYLYSGLNAQAPVTFRNY